MKRSLAILFGFACLFAIVLLVGSCVMAESPAESPPDSPRLASKDSLPTRIRLKSPNGKRSITITCQDYYAGIFIENREKGRAIHLYDTGSQQAIGFHNSLDNSRAQHACTLAFFVDENGLPCMQTVKNGDQRRGTLKTVDLSTVK